MGLELLQVAADDAQADVPPPDELRVAARLLEYRPGGFVAFPAHTTIALVDSPPVVVVPGAPYYCVGLMAWEGRQLPLLDLDTLLRAYPAGEPSTGHVLVLAYQSAPGRALDYGAVCARSLVRMIEVADSQACELPRDSDLWPWISMSCFEHEGRAVPVLDTARLFAPPQP
jgi:chemotaxis signal transduction protein